MTVYCHIWSRQLFLFIPFENPIDDLGDEERKDEQPHGKEDPKANELTPVSGGPYIFEGCEEEYEDESPDNNPQACPKEIIPETDLGQSHTKIQGRKRKIDET